MIIVGAECVTVASVHLEFPMLYGKEFEFMTRVQHLAAKGALPFTPSHFEIENKVAVLKTFFFIDFVISPTYPPHPGPL